MINTTLSQTGGGALIVQNLHYTFATPNVAINTFDFKMGYPLLVDPMDSNSFYGTFPVDAILNGVPTRLSNSLWIWHMQ